MKNMKKKITTLLATVVMAGALFAGPALARDNDHDGYRNDSWRSAQEWREHHPYQGYGDRRWSYGTDTKTSVAGTLTDIPTPGIEVIRTAGGIPLIPDLADITTVTTTAISQLPVRALSRKS